MPLDVGRVTHLAEQMHRSEDDAGDPIDDGFLLAADGARGLEWVDPATVGATALDDLSDVAITAPAEDDQLQYVSGVWVNNARRWEPVTTNPGGGPELVWDGDDIVMTWRTY